MSDNKRPLLLLSGGADSTYVAYLMAKEGKSFDILYVDCGQSRRKIKGEQAAIALILGYLQDKFPELGCSYYEPDSKTLMATAPGIRWSQTVPWMIGALEVANPERHSEVLIGYLGTDSNASCLHEYEAAWNALWAVSKDTDLVPIKFPLKRMNKIAVMADLPHDLYKHTWVCETPRSVYVLGYELSEVDPCGRCAACVNRKVEADRLKLQYGRETPLDNWVVRAEERDEKSRLRDEILLKRYKEASEPTPDEISEPEFVERLNEVVELLEHQHTDPHLIQSERATPRLSLSGQTRIHNFKEVEREYYP